VVDVQGGDDDPQDGLELPDQIEQHHRVDAPAQPDRQGLAGNDVGPQHAFRDGCERRNRGLSGARFP
jgi:hypothetical protein